jgi:hypothetical protein
MNVGVMKDYKLRDLRASHTLGWSWYFSNPSVLQPTNRRKVCWGPPYVRADQHRTNVCVMLFLHACKKTHTRFPFFFKGCVVQIT